MDSLVVDLNRNGPQSIEAGPTAFHADGPFEIVLDNHGTALHVYLQLDDDLAEVVSLGAVNHFVDDESIRRVAVEVDESRAPVRGRLRIVTGYGTETAFVPIHVEERDEDAGRVAVDDSLSRPKPRPEPEKPAFSFDLEAAPLLLLGALAVAVAVLAAVALDGELPLLAALIVLVGAGIGVVLLRG